jgi:hypothetical protein
MSATCGCDYERPEFYRAVIRKARKVHCCTECGGKIKHSEYYEAVAGKWEGEFYTFNTCSLCLSLRAYTVDNIPCACWVHGNMLEDCGESINEYAHELPGMLFGYYRKLIAIRRNRNITIEAKYDIVNVDA